LRMPARRAASITTCHTALSVIGFSIRREERDGNRNVRGLKHS